MNALVHPHVEAHVNARLEAFCDGVFAIALTLLIIEVRSPEAADVTTAPVLWSALGHLAPKVFAFVLSFVVILITWINHHNTLKLVTGTSVAFLYANGLLLAGVVCIPFTTSLLGAFVLSDAAGPAVALYDAMLALQAIGWIAVTAAALRVDTASEGRTLSELRRRRRSAYGAFLLYALLAVAALWLARTVAVVTAVTWLLWLAISLRTPVRSVRAFSKSRTS